MVKAVVTIELMDYYVKKSFHILLHISWGEWMSLTDAKKTAIGNG